MKPRVPAMESEYKSGQPLGQFLIAVTKFLIIPYLLEMMPQHLLISQLWREVTIPVILGVRLGRCL